VYKVDLSNSGNYTQYVPTTGDRGNVGFIKVDGVIWGDKKSSKTQLTSQWDYYSDGASILYIYSTTPPSANVIECNSATNGVT
jgi:hypothetical protein